MTAKLKLLTTEEEDLPPDPTQVARETRRLAGLPEGQRLLASAVEVYLCVLGQDPEYSPSTKSGYASDVSQFGRVMDDVGVGSVAEVDATALEAWRQSLQGRTCSTICRKIAAIHAFFEWAVAAAIAEKNPVSSLKRPSKKNKEAATVTLQDYERLNAACDNPTERCLLGLLFWAGLRRAEAAHLTVNCIDLENRTLRIEEGKGGHDRVIPICGNLVPLLEEALILAQSRGPEARVLMNRSGDPIQPRVVNRWFQRWVTRAGLAARGYTPHACRHGCASLLAAEGLSTLAISQMLGHQDAATSQRYVHSSPELLRRQIDQIEAFGTPPVDLDQVETDLRQQLSEMRAIVTDLAEGQRRLTAMLNQLVGDAAAES